VGAHLVAQKVDPHYFAFRWMTVLFSQDIEHLPDVLRVWDFLFGDPQGCKEAVMRFCCALLLVPSSLYLSALSVRHCLLVQSIIIWGYRQYKLKEG
jgi:Rab-GTPase-TBC domain